MTKRTTELHAAVHLTRGEIALIEMALIDMKRINAESEKRATKPDPNTEAGRKTILGRERLGAAIAKLEAKIHNADTRLAGGVGDAA